MGLLTLTVPVPRKLFPQLKSTGNVLRKRWYFCFYHMGYNLQELYYTKEHEWVYVGEKSAIVGITDYAQKALGDVVYLDFRASGKTVKQGESVATIESVKAVSEIYSPLTGKISQINENVNKNPAVVNRDPYGEGWLFEITDFGTEEIQNLLNYESYEAYLKTLP